MSLPQPIPLTDLANISTQGDYHGAIYYALTRPGSILLWGDDDRVNSLDANKPYGPGYSSLVIFRPKPNFYMGFVLDVNGRLKAWGDDYYFTQPEGVDRGDLYDYKRIDFYKLAPLLHSFTNVYVKTWHSYIPPGQYQPQDIYTTVAIAVTKDGDAYIWHEPLQAYTEPPLNPVPENGWHRDLDLSQFGESSTLVYNHNPALDKSLYPVSANASLVSKEAADKFTTVRLEEAAKFKAIPKIGETGLRAEASATLSIHEFVPKYARCFFFTRAVLVADNGIKMRMFGGSYSMYTTATLGATDTNLEGSSFLKVNAIRQRCIARNWDLMGQIQDELRVSTNC